MIAVFIFLVFGILKPEEIVKGLANKQVIIIFLLVIPAAGFKKEFGDGFFNYLFKPDLQPKQFLLRLMFCSSSCSAFINNTPIVAFMIPYVKDWADRRGLPASKFMIPLCFATVLGGMITVVGTSTNLLLNGLIAASGLTLLGYKDFLFIGLIVTILGVAYLYIIGYALLPVRKSATQEMAENLNEYVVEIIVEPASILIGESIKTRLRSLKNIYLFEVLRNGRSIFPVILLVASLAIGLALFKSGAANRVAAGVLNVSRTHPVAAISMLFGVTILITSVISNTATVAIVFPLAVSLSHQLHISNTPVFVAIAFALSCAFMTPIGYQCNLMVSGPGNYSFSDFFKIGFPLTMLYAAACLIFISWYYNL